MNRHILALILLVPTLAPAAPTQILGIPFGEKLSYSPSVCPLNTDKAKKICWVDHPFQSKDGSRSGYAHIPDPYSRPKWAAYASFDLSMSRDRTITRLKVATDGADRSDIYKSIATRFGLPADQSERGARWSNKDVNIDMLCASQTKCWTTFTIPPTEDDLKHAAELKARDKNRPITP